MGVRPVTTSPPSAMPPARPLPACRKRTVPVPPVLTLGVLTTLCLDATSRQNLSSIRLLEELSFTSSTRPLSAPTTETTAFPAPPRQYAETNALAPSAATTHRIKSKGAIASDTQDTKSLTKPQSAQEGASPSNLIQEEAPHHCPSFPSNIHIFFSGDGYNSHKSTSKWLPFPSLPFLLVPSTPIVHQPYFNRYHLQSCLLFVAYALHLSCLAYCVMFAALFLLQWVEEPLSCCMRSSGHTLFISAFIIASKIVCDDTSNKSWAVVSQGIFHHVLSRLTLSFDDDAAAGTSVP